MEVMKSFRFNIKVGPQNAKGIHLRKGLLNKPEEFTVTVQPVYKNDLHCGKFIPGGADYQLRKKPAFLITIFY